MSTINENLPIYKLKLHEITTQSFFKILRVPGGWIYTYVREDGPTSTFVPFNDEFSVHKTP